MIPILYLICALSCFFANNAEGLRPRIHGGSAILRTDPPAEQLKYVVGLRIKNSLKGWKNFFFENVGRCTGGIIHEKYVLTAAHCFTDDDKNKKNKDGTYGQKFTNPKVTIVANAININEKAKRGKTNGLIEVKAKKVYFTLKYMDNGVDDIAIVELEHQLDVKEGGQFKTLQLPGPSMHGRIPGTVSSYANTVAVIAGYGEDKIGKNDKSLKMAHARIVNPTICYKNYGSEFNDDRHMCAIAVTPDNRKPSTPLGACQGDSGGPLVDGNTVIGVFQATGQSCDGRQDKDPQIYTRVSHYKKFISDVILSNKKLAKAFDF